MACVDAATLRSDGGYEDDAAPLLRFHVRDAELREDERGPQIDVDGIVELLEAHVQNAGPPNPLPGVRDKDVRPRLPVLLVDFAEQLLDGLGRSRVDAVRTDLAVAAAAAARPAKLLDQGVDGLAVLEVREGQRGALGPQVSGTAGADPGLEEYVNQLNLRSEWFGLPLGGGGKGVPHTLLKHP